VARARAFQGLIWALIAVGVIARVAPFFDQGGRLMWQWPTEDGYFMLTIGRNLAIGNGFSIAGGEIPTNGTQPLMTFVWSLAFWLTGGGRAPGVLAVLIVELIGAVAAAWLLYGLARSVLADPRRDAVARLVAATWFASALVVPHSMNCLETGFYGLIAIAVARVFAEPESEHAMVWSWGKTFGVGVLLGVAFWIRNDSCFLIAAACLTHLFAGLPHGGDVVRARFVRTLVFGATSVVVASPWLIHNYVSFGHIMPVSGRAESLTGTFAGNLVVLPAVIVEYLGAVMPIPHSIQDTTPVRVACTLLLVAVVPALLIVWGRASRRGKLLIFLVTIYALGLFLFYGLFFGAGWFMPRYLFPLSPFFTILWGAAVFYGLGRLQKTPLAAFVSLAGGVGLVLLTAALHVRTYRGGDHHMHTQVVEWVKANVDESTWVGAIQTGTLGFFHDKTINLDGKVNIAAYEALSNARLAEYVVNDTKIEYLADWVGILDWRNMPLIAERFEVVVERPDINLGVLRRKTAAPETP
jgi:hypothetical protein